MSDRLTTYPTDQLAQAPADTSIAVVGSAPGGPGGATIRAAGRDRRAGAVVPVGSPDAEPATTAPRPDRQPGRVAAVVAGPAPGGVTGTELPSIFREADLTPFVLFSRC